MTAALVAALVLAACAVHRPYPVNWEPLPPSSGADCRRFEATYRDRDDTGRLSLVSLLFGRYTRHYREAQVTFRFLPDGRLEASVRDPGDPDRAPHVVAESANVACREGRLALSDTHSEAGAGTVSVARVTATMTLTDAWLVVHRSADEIGVAIVVPATGTTSSWMRFRRLPPE